MIHHITMHQIGDAVAYWGLFWNLLYVLCPPREYFNSPKYNKFLELVSYYGSLNLRSVAMKAYGAKPQDAPNTNPGNGGSTSNSNTPPAA
jgi:hypothetical protein